MFYILIYTDAPDAQVPAWPSSSMVAVSTTSSAIPSTCHPATRRSGPNAMCSTGTAKFPDPAGFVQSYLDNGVKRYNIKPCLLHDHPRFAEAEAAGLFIKSRRQSDVQFWDETGAYLISPTRRPTPGGRRESPIRCSITASPRPGTTTTNSKSGATSRWSTALASHAAPAKPSRCTPVDDQGFARSAGGVRAGQASFLISPLRRRRYTALRADLVGRQLHLLGNVAL